MKNLCFFVWVFFLWLGIMKWLFWTFILCQALLADKITLKGNIKNGTTGRAVGADSLTVLSLENGMQQIYSQQNISANFIIEGVEVPKSAPILLQVVYQGVHYNQLIPPVATARKKQLEIIVYDTIDSLKNLKINSLVQVVREQTGIRFYKIFLLDNQNQPARAIANQKQPLRVYIPVGASQINGQLKHKGAKMGIPIQLTASEEGTKLSRAILPGHSELEVSYLIPDSTGMIKDRMLFDNIAEFRPIFLKPTSMQVKFTGAVKAEEIEGEIPNGLRGYRVYYPEDQTIAMSFSGGQPVVERSHSIARKVVNGRIFTTRLKSIYATLSIIGLLFSLSFIFVYKKPV